MKLKAIPQSTLTANEITFAVKGDALALEERKLLVLLYAVHLALGARARRLPVALEPAYKQRAGNDTVARHKRRERVGTESASNCQAGKRSQTRWRRSAPLFLTSQSSTIHHPVTNPHVDCYQSTWRVGRRLRPCLVG